MFRNLVSACVLFIASQYVLAELSLPDKLPELATTSSQTLGTLDAGHGLAPGTTVPGFAVNDHFGASLAFESLLEKGPLMVVFYRGGWCPYCNRQIRALTQAWPEFETQGILPVLVSADKPDAAAIAQRSYEIPFPVLSDPQLRAHEAFKVTMQVPDELIPVYKDYGIVLEDWSGEDHHKIAVSSVFIVDTDGVVQWSHSSLDYKARPSVEQLLQVIDSLK